MLLGIFLEDFSRLFFPQNREKSGDKIREKNPRLKKNLPKSVQPRAGPNESFRFIFALCWIGFCDPHTLEKDTGKWELSTMTP